MTIVRPEENVAKRVETELTAAASEPSSDEKEPPSDEKSRRTGGSAEPGSGTTTAATTPTESVGRSYGHNVVKPTSELGDGRGGKSDAGEPGIIIACVGGSTATTCIGIKNSGRGSGPDRT